MQKSKTGKGVIIGKDVRFGSGITVWNYVVLGDNVNVGDGTRIGSFCDIGSGVIIGKNCNIQAHVTISNGCKIGNNVFIAPNSTLLNDKFPLSECLTPTVIEDDVVIGGCAVILPNLTIGEGSVVAAGSIVTKDVPPRTVVKGTPSKILMTREKYEAKKKVFINARQR
jgi:UDP-2-acetamido-3-amino-2,3-dideoxy-glucuronate N-acetyltransferase